MVRGVSCWSTVLPLPALVFVRLMCVRVAVDGLCDLWDGARLTCELVNTPRGYTTNSYVLGTTSPLAGVCTGESVVSSGKAVTSCFRLVCGLSLPSLTHRMRGLGVRKVRLGGAGAYTHACMRALYATETGRRGATGPGPLGTMFKSTMATRPILTPRGYQWPGYLAEHFPSPDRLTAREVMRVMLEVEGLPALHRMLRDSTLAPSLRLRVVELLIEKTTPPLTAVPLESETDLGELPPAQIIIEGAPPDEPGL